MHDIVTFNTFRYRFDILRDDLNYFIFVESIAAFCFVAWFGNSNEC